MTTGKQASNGRLATATSKRDRNDVAPKQCVASAELVLPVSTEYGRRASAERKAIDALRLANCAKSEVLGNIGSVKQMERKQDVILPDASRFSEVRRPDKVPILAIRPYTGTVAMGTRARGRDRSIGVIDLMAG